MAFGQTHTNYDNTSTIKMTESMKIPVFMSLGQGNKLDYLFFNINITINPTVAIKIIAMIMLIISPPA